MKKTKNSPMILIGNLLDHYDTHIYVLLTPYIAQIFFANDSILLGIIKAHGIALSGIIARPLGAVLFGRLADLIGPLKALRYSLIGVSISTFLIGLLPSYDQIGYMAPVLLLTLRTLQSIFASGEGAIAGLYLISNNPNNKSFFSSIYALSTLLGMLLASSICELISVSPDPLLYWRIAFILGFATSLVGLYIRGYNYKPTDVITEEKMNFIAVVKGNKSKIVRIAIICGFSYLTYPIALHLPNSLLPISKEISMSEILRLNTYLTIFDGTMIVLAGYIVKFISIERFMIACGILLALCECALFWIIPTASIDQITLMRVLVMAAGVPFSIAAKIWVANITDSCAKERYLISAIGGSVGMGILGRTLIVWSLSIYNMSGNFMLPILYVAILCACSIYSIYSYPRLVKPEKDEI
jgi:MFS family permease